MNTTPLEPDFTGSIGTTVADSVPAWRNHSSSGRARPNVLVIVLDDTGYSDLGCFGSEIDTPTIDGLAGRGVRYTNFHVTPLCSPTRASLLTGRNHHAVGMRFLADADTGFPNARGCIHPDVPLLPELLRRNGYGTYLVGKWHLAPLHEVTPAGPHHNWPLARGFDRFYGFLDGCTDQYTPELYEDNHQVHVSPPPGYHLSEDLTDRAIGYLTEHRTYRPHDQFFLQLALGATHAPFQAPRAYIDKYIDTFAKGWDITRADRLRRQRELGIMPGHAVLTPKDEDVPPWDSLTSEERLLYTHLQAAYAGFLEHADAQIGRLIAALEALDVLEDTIVLVMSDNGASREGGRNGAIDCNAPYSGNPQSVEEQLQHLSDVGGPNGPAHYPQGWAMAGNTPFRKFKQYVDLGGVRSPLVMSWPQHIPGFGDIRNQFVHAIDVMPTLLELTGLDPLPSADGASFAQTLKDAQADSPRDTQHWEMLGHRAIWHRGLKAVTQHVPGTQYEQDSWRLYDTASDPTEAHDLSAVRPHELRHLIDLWWAEAERHQVFPLDDRSLVELIGLRSPLSLTTRRKVTLLPDSGHVPFSTGLTGTERSMRITARTRPGAHDGVLISSGNSQGGYSLYLQNGHLHFEHHALGQSAVITSAGPVSAAATTFIVDLQRRPDRSAAATLWVDDDQVASGEVPLTSAHLSFWGADVGRDSGRPVSRAYDPPFALAAGVLRDVTLEFLEPSPIAEIAEALEHIE